MKRLVLLWWVAASAALLAAACHRSSDPPGPVAATNPVAPPSSPDHEQVVAIALASSVPLEARTESSCADVAADAGWSTLAELVRTVRADADEQSSSCRARAEGGWRCEIRFQNVHGGEEAEFLCVLELVVTPAEQVDPTSLRCSFAG